MPLFPSCYKLLEGSPGGAAYTPTFLVLLCETAVWVFSYNFFSLWTCIQA